MTLGHARRRHLKSKLRVSFPNKGKFFRRQARFGEPSDRFAMEIAAALQRASAESGLQVRRWLVDWGE
jgi:hypothetical protein